MPSILYQYLNFVANISNNCQLEKYIFFGYYQAKQCTHFKNEDIVYEQPLKLQQQVDFDMIQREVLCVFLFCDSILSLVLIHIFHILSKLQKEKCFKQFKCPISPSTKLVPGHHKMLTLYIGSHRIHFQKTLSSKKADDNPGRISHKSI